MLVGTIDTAILLSLMLAIFGGWISIRSWQGEIRSWRESTEKRLKSNDLAHEQFISRGSCESYQRHRVEVENLNLKILENNLSMLQKQLDLVMETLDRLNVTWLKVEKYLNKE